MKPAAFDYFRADSVGHALEALGQAGGDGKIIAGGQSLMPMINFRLVRPAVLVDINRIAGLDQVVDKGDRLHIGALVRHRMTATDPLIARHVPILHETIKNVAHMTVRNRGTFCGSVCHADPAAEMPLMALMLGGVVHIASRRGTRSLAAQDFFVGALTPALEADELVTGVEIEKLADHTGWGFEEFARRQGDYALAAVAVTLNRVEGRACDVRIGVMGVNEMSCRLPQAEAALEGEVVDDAAIARSVGVLRDALVPSSDLHGSAAYRTHLAGAIATRVIAHAWTRATERTAA